MELRFLGRGGAFYPEEGNTAAYIREGSRVLLLDCGETVFCELKKRRILEGISELWVAVSHLHGDHSGSLGTLGLYVKKITKQPMKIILPHDVPYMEQVDALMKLFGNSMESYDLLQESELEGFESVRTLHYVRTQHKPGMACHSFELYTP